MTSDIESPVRRHPWAFGIIAGVAGVILVSGLTAWGVSALLVGPGTAMGPAVPMAMSSATPVPAQTKAPQKRGIRGTITAIDGSTWTIATRAGATITVTVGSSTAYGTAASPASPSDFVVGSAVTIIGVPTGKTAGVATRVIATKDGVGVTPTPSATPNS